MWTSAEKLKPTAANPSMCTQNYKLRQPRSIVYSATNSNLFRQYVAWCNQPRRSRCLVSTGRYLLAALVAGWARPAFAIHKSTAVAPGNSLSVLSSSLYFLRKNSRRIIYGAFLLFLARSIVQWTLTKRRQRLDATSEWEYYSKHPNARGRSLFFLAMKLSFLYCLARLCGILNSDAQQKVLRYSGNMLADGLLQVGPLYIKLGQIISCREKLLPEPWKIALERLQDQVPAQSGEMAWKLAFEAWPRGERDFQQTFAEFESTPLAAASLGQVHKARLRHSNVTVAIKLQRPFLRQIYDQDLTFLKKIAKSVDKFGGSKGQVGGIEQSWSDIFEEAETILYREIDYRDEAVNGERFCQDFGIGLGGVALEDCPVKSRDGETLPSAADWIRAPFVYSDLSSEKVLVMEFVPSIKITDKIKLDEAKVTQEDREYLADCLGRSYLRQFCCNLFFTTDPHAGNLGCEILNENGKSPKERVRLVFYDFGQAASLQRDQADGILEIIEAIVDMDVDASIESFKKLGILKPNADMRKVRAKIADNYRTGKVKANRKRLSKRGYVFKAPSNTTSTIANGNSNARELDEETVKDSEVMQYFTMPTEYAFVGRALSQMDGVGKSLDADFDFVSSAAPWIVEIKGAKAYLQDEFQKWLQSVQKSVLKIFPHYVDQD